MSSTSFAETLQKDLRDGDKKEFTFHAEDIWREMSLTLDTNELSGFGGNSVPKWLKPSIEGVKQVVFAAADALVMFSVSVGIMFL